MFNLTDDRKYGLAALGTGLSQLAMGQPVNIAGSQAGQMVMQRQQRQRLAESGILDRFTPEQRAVLAQMPPNAAMQVIAGDAFRAPPTPVQGKVVADRLVNPITGEVIADFAGAKPNVSMIGPNDPSRATFGLPDDGKTYEVKYDPETMQVLDYSMPGGQGTSVTLNTGDQYTPGQKKVDEAYAERYLDYLGGKGADAASQAAQIQSVLAKLEAGEELTGPAVGLQGDFLRALINPDAQDAKERVESVVQRSLRETLGAQFTEKEGERLISRAYNINLKPEQNAARLRALFEVIQTRVDAERAMAEYFGEHKTLMGMSPVAVPTVDDMLAAMDAVVPAPEVTPSADMPPTAGAVEDGYRFKGGDPADPNNWEQVK